VTLGTLEDAERRPEQLQADGAGQPLFVLLALGHHPLPLRLLQLRLQPRHSFSVQPLFPHLAAKDTLNTYLSWAYCAEERKSASFFLVAPQRKLMFSKAQLRSLRFKLLDATFNRDFYEWIWYGKTILDRL
jgi:hypothetical protein